MSEGSAVSASCTRLAEAEAAIVTNPEPVSTVLIHTSDKVTCTHPYSLNFDTTEAGPDSSSRVLRGKVVATCKPGKRHAVIRSRRHVVVQDRYVRWDRPMSVNSALRLLSSPGIHSDA